MSGWIRSLYEWVLRFARSPHGIWALFLIAVAESSFFPVPPDVLLIALAVGAPHRAFYFAAVTTVGSVLGAGIGYWIGSNFFELIGRRIVEFYGLQDSYLQVQNLYQEWDVVAVGVAGFTPIPYKVFTIAAGAFELELIPFMLASIASRGLRFVLVGGLIYYFGPTIQGWIDRYLGWVAILFAILFVGGFVLVRYAIR